MLRHTAESNYYNVHLKIFCIGEVLRARFRQSMRDFADQLFEGILYQMLETVLRRYSREQVRNDENLKYKGCSENWRS
jgi:hypothetical protein